ncbi:MAG: NAD(P)-dependent dehydrogenase (short-subunit alcohol dehydrogenase family) [Crocinitomicaceae bacterium]|jgi:NAD(P)-dependent dehydrogenase (short-subunit alcohol dehydrogenase family)
MQKRLLITGGEGGIAMACREEFQSRGWEVLAPSRQELDVSDSESVEAFINNCGPIDLLLCAAGVTDDCLLGKMSETSWDNVLDVNLKGAFRCARAVSAQMLRRRSGHVVFVSSHSAFKPPLGQANYAAAKAGLVAMGKSLAREWGSRSVRVNVITPGFLETKMTEDVSDEVRQSALDKHTLGAFNTSENVARFVHFLDQTMLQTSGQVFHLDSRVL